MMHRVAVVTGASRGIGAGTAELLAAQGFRVEGTTITRQLTHEQMVELGAATPMGRLVRPDDVAKTVVFLASDDAGATTGHCIPVNGGVEMD